MSNWISRLFSGERQESKQSFDLESTLSQISESDAVLDVTLREIVLPDYSPTLMHELRQLATQKKRPLRLRMLALKAISEFADLDQRALPIIDDGFIQGVNENQLRKAAEKGQQTAESKLELYRLSLAILEDQGYQIVDKRAMADRFVRSVINGELEVVQEMLQNGADPNWNSANGLPLMRSITNGHEEIAILLIEHGANPESVETLN